MINLEKDTEFLKSETRIIARITSYFYLDLDLPENQVPHTFYLLKEAVPGTPYRYPSITDYTLWRKDSFCKHAREDLSKIDATELLTHDSPKIRKAMKLYFNSSPRNFERFCIKLSIENLRIKNDP